MGDGSTVPTAGAWRLDNGPDLALCGVDYMERVTALFGRYPITRVIVEQPLLNRYRDQVLPLRKRFGMDALLAVYCAEHDVAVEFQPVQALKKELGGFARADKDDMVWAAQKLGVVLPPNVHQGQQDAADAVGAWLIGVRKYARQHQPWIDRKLYSAKGAML